MEKFDFNGRNYKVVNGLAHEVAEPSKSAEHGLVLIPIYKGDNLMLDAYCKELGVRIYDRPLSDGDPDKEYKRHYPIQADTAAHLTSYTDWATKRIKDVLIDLAVKDELPPDLNELDPGVFEAVVLEILK